MKLLIGLLRWIQRYYVLLTWSALVITLVASLWPNDQLPAIPGGDKTHHFIAYAAITFPLALRWPRSTWLSLSVVVVMSGLIELIQPYVNRYAEWLDFGANMLGIIVGIALGLMLRRLAAPKATDWF